jgi:hypothetical protein
MVWLLASAAAICTAMACSGDDEGAEANVALPNQPGAGGSSGNGGTSNTASGGTGGNIQNPPTAQSAAGNGGTFAAGAATADAGAVEEDEDPVADAGPPALVADAAPPVNPPPANPPPANPPPANPPPAADVGFSEVFPVLVAATAQTLRAIAPASPRRAMRLRR